MLVGIRDRWRPAEGHRRETARPLTHVRSLGRGEAAARREARVAVAIAAALYLTGAALTATSLLLPSVEAPGAVFAVATTAVLTAAALWLAVLRRRAGLTLAFFADLWGVVLIAVLCGATGGASSPFALIYFFALGHAAAFQPRRRLLIVSVAVLVAFLAPLAYKGAPETFGAIACVGVVLALLAGMVIHVGFERMRAQRRSLQFLIDASARLDTSLDPQETLRKIAATAVPELAELCVIDLLTGRGSIGESVAAASDPAIAESVERLRRERPLDLAGNHPVAQVLRRGGPMVFPDLTDPSLVDAMAQSEEHRSFIRHAGYRSAAVFPMVARGRTHGVVSFLHLGVNAHYAREDLAVLADLAGRAAMAFDNARLYAERAHVARTLQRSLIPAALPVVAGLELASCFRPAGAGNEVGGDFYDVLDDGDCCWLVVGDVCGKGAEAAALTGFLRHTTIAYAREGMGPASVLLAVNRAMLEQDFEGRFATAILVRLRFDGQQAAATIATAGHPAALIARAGGAIEEHGARGALLGVFPDPVIEDVTTALHARDTLALYTDGLLEAHAPQLILTSERLRDQLTRSAPESARGVVDSLLQLAGPEEQARDDIAILAARPNPRAGH